MNKVLPSIVPCLFVLGIYFSLYVPAKLGVDKQRVRDGDRAVHTNGERTYRGDWQHCRFVGQGTLTKANNEVIEGYWSTCRSSLMTQEAYRFDRFPACSPNIVSQHQEIDTFYGEVPKIFGGTDRSLAEATLCGKVTIRTTLYTRVGGCLNKSVNYEEANLCCIDILIIDNVEHYFVSNRYQITQSH